jgi:regulator of CtrA degradation
MDRQPTFFNGPYDEAMALLEESRDYVSGAIESNQEHIPAGARLKAGYESMRVTSRLTQVMAWLLAQKAMHAGEITAAELASEKYALGGASVCCGDDSAARTDLPAGLRRLLGASHGLYQRVARLDAMVRRSIENEATADRNANTRQTLSPVG